MTLLLPNLFYLIIKTSLVGILLAGHVIKYLEQEFPMELFGWLGYILIPHIAALLQGYIGFICGILSVPLYFWKLLWHPNGRSIYDMLCNPEGQGRFISRTSPATLIHSRPILRNTQSISAMVFSSTFIRRALPIRCGRTECIHLFEPDPHA